MKDDRARWGVPLDRERHRLRSSRICPSMLRTKAQTVVNHPAGVDVWSIRALLPDGIDGLVPRVKGGPVESVHGSVSVECHSSGKRRLRTAEYAARDRERPALTEAP
jgi:hypothetical protein